MLFTLLMVTIVLAASLFLYTTAGVLIHLCHVYVDGRAQKHSHMPG